MHPRIVIGLAAALAAWGLAAAPQASAQEPSGTLQLPAELGNFSFGLGVEVEAGKEVAVSARVEPLRGREGRLFVETRIAPGYHLYSLTQKPGVALPTTITVEPSSQFELSGPFTADQKFIARKEGDDLLEEHDGVVTFSAPLRFAEGVDPAQVQVKGTLEGLACSDRSCIPQTHAFVADVVSPSGQDYRPEKGNIAVRGQIEPAQAAPGQMVRLTLSIIPDEGWHVYAYEETKPEEGSLPTLIALELPESWSYRRPAPASEPLVKPASDFFPEQRYYKEPAQWTVEIQVPSDATAGEQTIGGLIGWQVCFGETQCLPPQAARFEAPLTISAESGSGAAPLAFANASYDQVATLAETVPASRGFAEAPAATGGQRTFAPIDPAKLAVMMMFGFLGGIILNLMPCVLPVIGLKILAFAQQAGQSRARIISLNLVFSIGLISVFMALGTLAAFLNLGWGEQFTFTWFKVTMIALVFAMALSFLGVWEIPIPGFVGAGKSNQLQQKEGMAGAFFKGVFTTILATPCSGPFLGPVFGYTLTQPPVVTYLLFFSVGLGMASPYLLVGAFPSWVRYFPKPGEWMETFKQFMGFVLLGTVVFLFSSLNPDYFIPTLSLVVGIWFACWQIGRVPFTATSPQKAKAWAGGVGVAALVGFLSFSLLTPSKSELDWQPWSPAALAQAKAEGKTVMVDFTAQWCLTCKANLKFAINTNDVKRVVEQNDVVPLLADWTDRGPAIKEALAQLDSNSIPVLAIYPADRPHEPIILRDAVLKGQVVEALQAAGPSRDAPPAAATAMNSPGD